ncbi:MAG: porin [Opitutaceae bacterium]
MKNKIAIASAFIAASSFSMGEIVINDFLSFEGFVDMSYQHAEADYSSGEESENSFGIDQVEISWLFDFDPVTAQIDLEYEEAGDGVNVEQAFVTYHFDNGGAITAGRYASMLGFEAFEPTGLYQFSFAYASSLVDGSDYTVLPGYSQGVKYTHEGDGTFFGISLQDQSFGNGSGRLLGDNSGNSSNPDSSYGVEVAGAFYMDNGLSYFLGGAYEDADSGDEWVINTYVTFETGAWIFAAELIYGEDDHGDHDEETLAALIMANFAYSDQASVTGRISIVDEDDGGYDQEFLKYTVAHNYAFTDNLLLVAEVSYIEFEEDFSDDSDELSAALELLFTF